jgi:hypothetical protein
VDWDFLVRWEWLILELVVLALALWQLVSVRREIRRSRAEEARRAMGGDEPPARGTSH